MRDVAIIGVGETQIGELWDKSLRELGIEAGLKALKDAGLKGDEVEKLYVGNMSAGKLINQEHVAPLIADYAGFSDIPSIRIESGSASGGMALAEGYKAVASGMEDLVVVGGAEKMTDVGEQEAKDILSSTADQEWETVFGSTFDSLYAMMARYHMNEFGTTKDQLAQVAVKNHSNAAKNPNAQYPRETSKDFVKNAPMVADPLGMFDCAPISDGGAAVVLCPADRADTFRGEPVSIVSLGQGGDYMAVHERENIGTMEATKRAAKKAYQRAGIAPKDIDFAEVHDNYTITEIMSIEDLGFFEKGEGGPATEEGKTELNSEISINISGGLKAKGRPVGAVGLNQAVEAVLQLREDAGGRQVEDPDYGMIHNIGGTGASAIVHILRRWS
ncbi:MAG: thiolase domain-containing protein [Candidatus Aenigmatarchaeota archaeon]